MTDQSKTLTAYLNELKNVDDIGITFISGPDSETFLSYAALRQSALVILGNLQKAGLKPGDELVFQIPDNESFIKVFWACLFGKIIPVPISIANKSETIEKALNILKVLSRPYIVIPTAVIDKMVNGIGEVGSTYSKDIRNIIIELEPLLDEGLPGKPETVSPDDIAYIQFSSGSTGRAKGVLLSHRNLVANIEDMIAAARITKKDKILSWLPLTHDMGLVGQHLRPLCLGIPTFLLPPQLFMRKPLLWISKTSEHRATILCAPNFGFQYFLSALTKQSQPPTWDLSALRLVYNGAEPISYPVVSAFETAMKPFGMVAEATYPVYGLAEASLAVSHPRPPEKYCVYHLNRYSLQIGQKVEFIEGDDNPDVATFIDTGFPLPRCLVRITDDDDIVLGENTIGHIQMQGPNITQGYYKNEAATNRLFTDDNWCRTGDLGFLYKGRLCITGRSKEIIIIRGQNYIPSDIEETLSKLEGISSGKVVAAGYRNEEEGTENMIIFVATKSKPKDFFPIIETVKTHINEVMGLRVEEVIPIRRIIRTTSGKVRRFAMVNLWRSGEYDPVLRELRLMAGSNNLYLQEIYAKPPEAAKKQIAEVLYQEANRLVSLPVSVLTDKSRGYFDSGFDSLTLTRFHGSIEKRFAGIHFPVTVFFKYSNFPGLADYIYTEIAKMSDHLSPTDTDAVLDQVKTMSDKEIAELLTKEE